MDISATNPIPAGALERAMQICHTKLAELWRAQRKRKSLLVKETAGLGERRFVAVVQFERQRFLIGGSPGSITLLARLPDEESAGEER
ncbi:MAG: flagellar biosynthetic protein FliO [Candidatus Koribacter versatilis]|nr:flagellar biosynthetic protein FliO [Candidatus Koribacter versatilis]